MNISDYLVKIIGKQLKEFTYTEIAERVGLSYSTVHKIRNNKDGVRLETEIQYLLMYGDNIKLKFYNLEIVLDNEDAKNKMEQAKAQLKEIIKKIAEEKHESFRSASLSIGKKENYIWEKLKRDSGMDGLFYILQSLGEKVELFVNNERMTYNLANVF